MVDVDARTDIWNSVVIVFNIKVIFISIFSGYFNLARVY